MFRCLTELPLFPIGVIANSRVFFGFDDDPSEFTYTRRPNRVKRKYANAEICWIVHETRASLRRAHGNPASQLVGGQILGPMKSIRV